MNSLSLQKIWLTSLFLSSVKCTLPVTQECKLYRHNKFLHMQSYVGHCWCQLSSENLELLQTEHSSGLKRSKAAIFAILKYNVTVFNITAMKSISLCVKDLSGLGSLSGGVKDFRKLLPWTNTLPTDGNTKDSAQAHTHTHTLLYKACSGSGTQM